MDKGSLGSPSGQSSDSGGNAQRHITGTDIEKAVAVESKKRSTIHLNRKFKFSFTWLWGGLLIAENIALAIFAVFAMQGRLLVSFKEPGQTAKIDYDICRTDVVAKYNKLQLADSNDGYYENSDKLTDLASEIKNMSNYDKDINCQYMVFNIDLMNGKLGEAREELDTIKNMSSKGLVIDDSLVGIKDLSSMQKSYEAYKSESDNGWKSNGRG